MELREQTVMVIDPRSRYFLRTGRILDDGREWKIVGLGFGQPVPIEPDAVMEEKRAVRMLRVLMLGSGRWSGRC